MRLSVYNSTATTTYTLTESPIGGPYLHVNNSYYLPLTTSTSQGVRAIVESGTNSYRPMVYGTNSLESDYYSSSTDPGHLSSTTALTRESTSSTTYGTQITKTGEEYKTQITKTSEEYKTQITKTSESYQTATSSSSRESYTHVTSESDYTVVQTVTSESDYTVAQTVTSESDYQTVITVTSQTDYLTTVTTGQTEFISYTETVGSIAYLRISSKFSRSTEHAGDYTYQHSISERAEYPTYPTQVPAITQMQFNSDFSGTLISRPGLLNSLFCLSNASNSKEWIALQSEGYTTHSLYQESTNSTYYFNATSATIFNSESYIECKPAAWNNGTDYYTGYATYTFPVGNRTETLAGYSGMMYANTSVSSYVIDVGGGVLHTVSSYSDRRTGVTYAETLAGPVQTTVYFTATQMSSSEYEVTHTEMSSSAYDVTIAVNTSSAYEATIAVNTSSAYDTTITASGSTEYVVTTATVDLTQVTTTSTVDLTQVTTTSTVDLTQVTTTHTGYETRQSTSGYTGISSSSYSVTTWW